jgi:hypothetical protein
VEKCDIEVRLETADAVFRPGDPIRGEVLVTPHQNVTARRLLVELAWETHGAGSTNTTVVDTLIEQGGAWSAGSTYRFPFHFTAPYLPLTYHGHHLNVDHFVNARADLPWAIDPQGRQGYVLRPGPGSYEAYLEADFDAPAPASPNQPLVLKIIGWILIPVVLLLLAALMTVLIPILLVIGLVVLGRKLLRRIAERRLGEVKVILDTERIEPRSSKPTYLVYPGQTPKLTVSFTPTSSFRIKAITARLLGRESCRAGSGRNERRFKHTLCDEEIRLVEDHTTRLGWAAEFEAEIPIPETPAYTINTRHNQLEWKLDIRIDLPGFPDWTTENPLRQAPPPMSEETSWLS